MEDQELKLELLRLAVAKYGSEHGVSIVDVANGWYEWATGRDEKVQVEQGKSDSAPKATTASLAEMAAYAKGRVDQAYGVPYNPFYDLPCNKPSKS